MTPRQHMNSENVPDELLRLARTAGDAYDKATGNAFTWEGYREANRCGCGHTWDPNRSERFRRQLQTDPGSLLREVAATGELPDLPERITRGEG